MPLITLNSPLYLASSNPGKLREFSAAAQACGIRVEPLPGFKSLPICIEDGNSFEENARKKALHYSTLVSGAVFADDSGIGVDALGGAPGIFSARFAGPDATDDDNNRKLIGELRRIESVHDPESRPTRAAHYVCIIAMAQAGRVLCVTEGGADGVILDQPQGTGGFGYDPYFFYAPLGKTFAELNPEEKYAVSHRGKAFRQLLDLIEDSTARSS
ncbi:Non-canonical purine NTP pyrophosphatase [Acidobacteriia bacterium SbA2]|nr:Non-canonical purine NTP pyrophosphatase [Acidobacteriia bacterium SbA2]